MHEHQGPPTRSIDHQSTEGGEESQSQGKGQARCKEGGKPERPQHEAAHYQAHPEIAKMQISVQSSWTRGLAHRGHRTESGKHSPRVENRAVRRAAGAQAAGAQATGDSRAAEHSLQGILQPAPHPPTPQA
mmetsp:Transcript_28526/g.44623  ORF Transcript_28526/g.44623 Transcript_28526/m.44623 type:complete len:131 (-) Transcript_28526:109-501(-)